MIAEIKALSKWFGPLIHLIESPISACSNPGCLRGGAAALGVGWFLSAEVLLIILL